MTTAFILVGLALLLGLVGVFAYVVTSAKRTTDPKKSPRRVARARLEREIAGLHAKLSEQPDARDPVALAVWQARQAWWQSQLAKTPVSSLRADGFGPATYETLKRHGINTAGDVQRLQYVRIRGFGERKRDALMSAYRRLCDELQQRNQKLSWEELDAVAGGNILRLRQEMSARTRAKLRAEEAMRIRLLELQRRHAAVSALRREEGGSSP